ncbi:YheV family putative metal-binding protein [Pseudidiomarina sp. 1APP75-27a]|uniref:YheV family putative zinc ribbon protein n=1 Tax=Pseudidiomarina terrestris TaxID=2820060 RepID=UPI002B05C148|nr:YheV family putative zinc ribbon protein [Pseudidiomarina sp. 1APP75-27a]MEA3588326.1 YheV family putative metal-binding protein [Pseudidiomarina sp. 1APP75-27a]
MARTRKRFIAGAECPACQASDTLMLLITETVSGEPDEQVECVSCHHRFTEQDKKPQQEPATTSAKAVKDDNVIGIFKPE